MSATSTTGAAGTATAAPEKSSAAGAARSRSRGVATRSSGPPLRADSAETKRLATAILEVLAGVRTPTDAAKSLEIQVSRYYLLETRALGGLVAACATRPKGPGRSADRERAKLERELAASRRDAARLQALLRAAQRALGLAPPSLPKSTPKSSDKNGAKPARRRRPTARALRAARAIDGDSSGTNSPDGVQPSPSAGTDESAVSLPTHSPPPSAAVDHGGSP